MLICTTFFPILFAQAISIPASFFPLCHHLFNSFTISYPMPVCVSMQEAKKDKIEKVCFSSQTKKMTLDPP